MPGRDSKMLDKFIERFEMAWADYVIAEIDSSEQKQQSKWICSNHVEAYMVQP
jgi:hypothetical protein